jgi:phosphatidate phosphatase
LLLRKCFDFFFFSVGIPILAFFLFGSAYERGFFCDDESLMHPFHESTVTHEVLYSVGFGLPILTIVITEFVRWRLSMDEERELKFFGREIPFYVQNFYKYYGIFLFGAACSQLTTDIGKYTIGRFRPHFISVCQPIMPDGSNCTDPRNLNIYHEDFTCGNTESSARRLKEMRLSFPSGHSSFSMYTMVFAALYLHCRMNFKGSKLFKHFLQFAFIMMAWYTALSRISDYKHHCKSC